MSKIKINKRTEYEIVIPTNTFGGDRIYKTDGEGKWLEYVGEHLMGINDEKSLLLELIFQTHKGDTTGEPSDDSDDGEDNGGENKDNPYKITLDEQIQMLQDHINLYKGMDNQNIYEAGIHYHQLINYMKKMIEWNK